MFQNNLFPPPLPPPYISLKNKNIYNQYINDNYNDIIVHLISSINYDRFVNKLWKRNALVVSQFCLNVKLIFGDYHIHFITKNITDQIWLILNNMMFSLSFPANIKYSPKTLILFFFIGVQTKFFLRGCWTRLDIINRRLGATSSSWVHCTFSQTLCCKNDFRNVSRILSLSCLVHLVEYARIHSFL